MGQEHKFIFLLEDKDSECVHFDLYQDSKKVIELITDLEWNANLIGVDNENFEWEEINHDGLDDYYKDYKFSASLTKEQIINSGFYSY